MRSLSAHSPHPLHLASVHCPWCPAEIGPPAHVPPVRRRVDVHREEPAVQDGVERGRLRAEDQDRGLQERRRHRGGQEVMPFTPNFSPCTLPVVHSLHHPTSLALHSHPHDRWRRISAHPCNCTLHPRTSPRRTRNRRALYCICCFSENLTSHPSVYPRTKYTIRQSARLVQCVVRLVLSYVHRWS